MCPTGTWSACFWGFSVIKQMHFSVLNETACLLFMKKAHHLLEFNFLKRFKFTSPSLHDQVSLGSVFDTLFRGTFSQRCQVSTFDFLKDFWATGVTGKCVDKKQWLDFWDSRDDSSDWYQFSQMYGLDLPNRQSSWWSWGSEIKITKKTSNRQLRSWFKI
jgi:hypothetical protein